MHLSMCSILIGLLDWTSGYAGVPICIKILTKTLDISTSETWNTSHYFFCIELKLCTVVTLITKFHNVHCDISMATQWTPGPLHSKGKIRVSLLQEVLFACVVHSVRVSKYGHYTGQAQECLLDYEAKIRHFSFWEDRGLVMSMLPQWHHFVSTLWPHKSS